MMRAFVLSAFRRMTLTLVLCLPFNLVDFYMMMMTKEEREGEKDEDRKVVNIRKRR